MENQKSHTISRKTFSVTLNNREILMPEYTKTATSRYRVYEGPEENQIILKKQCPECLKWFNIASFESNTWIDISDETEYRKTNSGAFPTYCTICSKTRNERKNPQPMAPNNVIRQSEVNGLTKKDTVVWTADVYDYIMIRSLLDRKSKNEFLNLLIRKEMATYPISISVNNTIK